MEKKRHFGLAPLGTANKQKLESTNFSLGTKVETYEPSLLSGDIYITPELWQRKLSATKGSIKSAAAIALGAEGIDTDAAQLAARSLGVKSIAIGMTESEGRATAIIDAAAIEMLKAESAIEEHHWYKIIRTFHPTSNLSEEKVAEIFDGLKDLDLSHITLSASPTTEDIRMTVDGNEILLSKDQYLSLLATDLYIRARDNRGLWDTHGPETPLSILATALRKQVHLGVFIQRSDEVLERIKQEQKANLSPELLALLAAEHLGYHGTGEEKFYIKMADGSVVEQTRMKECDGCANGAEETIKNLAPEIEISEMVAKFEARTIEQIKTEPTQEVVYFIPPVLVVPLDARSSVSANSESSNAKRDTSFSANVAKPTTERKPSAEYWWAQPTSNRREASVNPTTIAVPITSNEASKLVTTRKRASFARKSNFKPTVQIVTMSTGESLVVAEGRSRQSTVDSGRVKTTLPRVSKVKVWERGSRREIGRTNDNPTALRSLNGRIKSESRGGRGESPHSRPSNTLDGNTRGATSIPKAHTHTKIEKQITGTLLRQAIERVEAKVEVKIGTTSTSFEKKEVKAKSKTHKPILVTPVANAIREDAAPLVASIVTTPTPPNPVRTTYRVRSRKGGLRAGASIALNAPNLRLDVSNGRSAKEMFLSALGA